MALDFPASPVNGATYAAPNGASYVFHSTPAPGYWSGSGVAGGISSGTTPPGNPVVNQLWFNTDGVVGGGVLYTYYDDGNTKQWVPVSPSTASVSVPPAPPTYDENTTWGAMTGTLPLNDTVPLVANGNRIFQRSFTALSAAHRIRVWVGGQVATAAAADVALVLFIDNVAVRTRYITTAAAAYSSFLQLHWEGVLVTGAHTYEVRLGAATQNTFINGSSSSRYHGGTEAWTLTIEELVAP
jgi:hypothetical protein